MEDNFDYIEYLKNNPLLQENKKYYAPSDNLEKKFLITKHGDVYWKKSMGSNIPLEYSNFEKDLKDGKIKEVPFYENQVNESQQIINLNQFLNKWENESENFSKNINNLINAYNKKNGL